MRPGPHLVVSKGFTERQNTAGNAAIEKCHGHLTTARSKLGRDGLSPAIVVMGDRCAGVVLARII